MKYEKTRKAPLQEYHLTDDPSDCPHHKRLAGPALLFPVLGAPKRPPLSSVLAVSLVEGLSLSLYNDTGSPTSLRIPQVQGGVSVPG